MKKANFTIGVLILTVLSSLFSDLFSGTTIYLITILTISYMFYIIKNKVKLSKLDKYSVIIYINMLFVLLSIFKNGISSISIKYLFYYFSIAIIYEIVDLTVMKKIFKIVNFLMFFISLYVIYKGIIIISLNIDLVNIRNELIIQKQSFNILYTLVIPYNIYIFTKNRKKSNFIILIINIFSGIFILQIKSLIINIFVGYIISLYLLKKIKIRQLIGASVLFLSILISFWKFNVVSQLTPIIDYIINGSNSSYIGSNYLDTLLLRNMIL